MDAAPLLGEIRGRLEELGLEAVLIGNAAAALQGAPVTTVDFDVLSRKTPRNLRKLNAVARGSRAACAPMAGAATSPARACPVERLFEVVDLGDVRTGRGGSQKRDAASPPAR